MQQTYKPGSVLRRSGMPVICLDCVSLRSSIDLPPDIGRAALHASVYMIFQPMRRTARDIAAPTGGLLPHLFTLTAACRGGFSLLRYSALANSFPLGSMVLCVARTFLPFYTERATDRSAASVQR